MLQYYRAMRNQSKLSTIKPKETKHYNYVPGLSLRAGGQGFFPRILRYIPGYFDIKPLSNPRLLFVYPHLLQKLVTALYVHCWSIIIMI